MALYFDIPSITPSTGGGGGGGGEEYGANVSTFLGEVDSNGVYQPPSGAVDIEIPATSIGGFPGFQFQFYGRDTVKNFNMTDLTSVPDEAFWYAFRWSWSIISVNFCNVVDVGYNSFYYAFHNASYLESANFHSVVNADEYSFYYAFHDTSVTDLDFSSLQNVEISGFNHAFTNSPYLQHISFPSLVWANSYGFSSAFQNCVSLVSAEFNSLETTRGFSFDNAFNGCVNLRTLLMPNLTSFAGFANMCRDCVSLQEINFCNADAVGTMGGPREAFMGCTNLVSANFHSMINVGTGINTMMNMFNGCTNLTSVDFSSLALANITNCFRFAFNGCSSLETISFPSLKFGTNKTVFNAAFTNCPNLREIHFRADVQTNVTALTGYASKFGASNATIYFDL